MPEDVEETKESILEDNPEMDESTAYAIAYDQHDGEKSAKEKLLEVFEGATPGERMEMAKAASVGSVEKHTFEITAEGSVGALYKSDEDFVIWGPASVEVVDKENDRIKAEALKKALPQLLKRSTLSYEHSDQIVGDIKEKFVADEPQAIEVNDHQFKRQEFPTDVLKIGDMPPALYVCGNIYGDTQKSQEVRDEIEKGNIRSFSISGEAVVSSMSIEDGKPVTDISKLDLSAVTLCKEGMNQLAKFGVVKKMEGHTTKALQRDQAETLLNKTMSDNDNEPLSKSGMNDLLDKHLPDGEIATEDYVDKRIEQEVNKKDATETGSPTEGSAERPDGDDGSPTMQDSEYEGDAEDETASDPDKVEEKMEGHPEGCMCEDCQRETDADDDTEKSAGYSMDELKSALPDDQFKAIKPALERMDQGDEMGDVEVVEDDDEEEPMLGDEYEDDDEEYGEMMEEGRKAAKMAGISPDNLTDEQVERLAKSADVEQVDGAVPPGSSSDESALVDDENDLAKTAKGTTMAGSNFFDENGGVNL